MCPERGILQLFDPPTAYQAAYQQPTGSRFGGDALYNGENRRFGAMISYYINRPEDKKAPEEAEDKKKKKKKNKNKKEETKPQEETKPKVAYDSIKLEIYDGTRLIRTLKQKAPKENGMHKIYWFMDEKGVDRPSRSLRERRNEPSGVSVKPGTYQLKMYFGDQTSESSIEVAYDPRLKMSDAAIDEIYNTSKDMEKDQQLMSDVVEQLVESKNIATNFKSKLSKEDADASSENKKYKEEIKASDEIAEEIDKLIALFLGKVDRRQGITRNPEVTISQRFSTARQYVGSRYGNITATERQLIKQYKDAMNDAIQKVNEFFDKDWKDYKAKVETINISPFKEIKKF